MVVARLAMVAQQPHEPLRVGRSTRSFLDACVASLLEPPAAVRQIRTPARRFAPDGEDFDRRVAFGGQAGSVLSVSPGGCGPICDTVPMVGLPQAVEQSRTDAAAASQP